MDSWIRDTFLGHLSLPVGDSGLVVVKAAFRYWLHGPDFEDGKATGIARFNCYGRTPLEGALFVDLVARPEVGVPTALDVHITAAGELYHEGLPALARDMAFVLVLAPFEVVSRHRPLCQHTGTKRFLLYSAAKHGKDAVPCENTYLLCAWLNAELLPEAMRTVDAVATAVSDLCSLGAAGRVHKTILDFLKFHGVRADAPWTERTAMLFEKRWAAARRKIVKSCALNAKVAGRVVRNLSVSGVFSGLEYLPEAARALPHFGHLAITLALLFSQVARSVVRSSEAALFLASVGSERVLECLAYRPELLFDRCAAVYLRNRHNPFGGANMARLGLFAERCKPAPAERWLQYNRAFVDALVAAAPPAELERRYAFWRGELAVHMQDARPVRDSLYYVASGAADQQIGFAVSGGSVAVYRPPPPVLRTAGAQRCLEALVERLRAVRELRVVVTTGILGEVRRHVNRELSAGAGDHITVVPTISMAGVVRYISGAFPVHVVSEAAELVRKEPGRRWRLTLLWAHYMDIAQWLDLFGEEPVVGAVRSSSGGPFEAVTLAGVPHMTNARPALYSAFTQLVQALGAAEEAPERLFPGAPITVDDLPEAVRRAASASQLLADIERQPHASVRVVYCSGPAEAARRFASDPGPRMRFASGFSKEDATFVHINLAKVELWNVARGHVITALNVPQDGYIPVCWCGHSTLYQYRHVKCGDYHVQNARALTSAAQTCVFSTQQVSSAVENTLVPMTPHHAAAAVRPDYYHGMALPSVALLLVNKSELESIADAAQHCLETLTLYAPFPSPARAGDFAMRRRTRTAAEPLPVASKRQRTEASFSGELEPIDF